MSLTVGDRIAHYDVTAKIGEGGMGQVYRATDTKLDRDVALKVLPQTFTEDPDRLARFEREAKVLASLNHPGIAAIHGLEESGGIKALVLELVEGPTLADRIAKGPIPLDEALPIAKQIAEALEAAHEAGVIHRDLKPANIKVRDDGTVKVLDFGLAKALDPTPEGDPSQSPTLTAAATQMGVIMGTAAYMSPEQAAGKPTDKRSDIWSFGVVVYEMLTGQRLFTGDTVQHVLARILERHFDLGALPVASPPTITWLLRRCLERDPKLRLRDIGEVRVQLEGDGSLLRFQAAQRPRGEGRVLNWRHAIAFGVVCVAVGGLVAATVVRNGRPLTASPLARFTVQPPTGERLFIAQDSGDLAISPDGNLIAYLTGDATLFGPKQLKLRALDELTPTTVTEGVIYHPFFSHDGQWIGFYDIGADEFELKRISVTGGPALTVCRLRGPMRGATWAEDDTIIFATHDPDSGLWRVSADGGEPEPLTTPGGSWVDGDHFWPELLPGGDVVLFTIMAEEIQDSQIAVLSLETGEQRVVVQGGHNPRYLPTGHIVYGRDSSLRAVRFDLDSLQTIGRPELVAEGVMTKALGATGFGISETGSLVYLPETAVAGGASTLVWVDRDGHETPLSAAPRYYGGLRLSPDGERIVFDVGVAGSNTDINIYDLVRNTPTRVTFDPSVNISPLFTPDGERVLFASRRLGGLPNLFVKAADGTGEAELLLEGRRSQLPGSYSPEGESLAVVGSREGTTGFDIGVLRVEADHELEWLLDSEFNETYPEISPDGHWLAYVSDESGQNEVYVRPFPNVAAGRSRISRDGGSSPAWGESSRELFYQVRAVPGGPVTMMVAENEVGAEFSPGAPVALFEGPYRMGLPGEARLFDVSSDGRRFLMVKAIDAMEREASIVLVQNWHEELKRLVPVDRHTHR